jgi:hypothetical protein
MKKHISFSDTVKILNQFGIIEISTLSIKMSLKKKQKSLNSNVKKGKTYCQKKAYVVGSRIEQEVKNRKLLRIRNKQELIVENLLTRYKLYNTINKVYRLSNNALIALKNKLITLKID